MLGFLAHRRRTGNRRKRIDQLGRVVGRAADFAGIAILILGMALRALALDETVGQEHILDRIEKLLDGSGGNLAVGLQRLVDAARQFAVFFRVGGIVVIELDQKSGKIGAVLGMHALDQLLRRDALFFRAQHDGRTVRVVRANIVNFMPLHFLKAHPDIRLNIFDQMPEMNAAIGIRQGRSDKDFARLCIGHECRLK